MYLAFVLMPTTIYLCRKPIPLCILCVLWLVGGMCGMEFRGMLRRRLEVNVFGFTVRTGWKKNSFSSESQNVMLTRIMRTTFLAFYLYRY